MTNLAGRTYIALLHHPVYDRTGRVVATAITNLDIHDLARSSKTYGLARYYIVTPLERQRELATRIVGYWGEETGPRAEALALVEVRATVEEVIAEIEERHGRPYVVATAANPPSGIALSSCDALCRELEPMQGRPLLLLFGTGWGLERGLLERCDRLLAPIRGPSEYNHLSVRSAAAIMLDRLFGERLKEP